MSFADDFRAALSYLGSFPAKPEINMLTDIAAENKGRGAEVVAVLAHGIAVAPPENKLSLLCLLDSILKNVGGSYVQLVAAQLPGLMTNAFTHMRPSDRATVVRILESWEALHLFHVSILSQLRAHMVPSHAAAAVPAAAWAKPAAAAAAPAAAPRSYPAAAPSAAAAAAAALPAGRHLPRPPPAAAAAAVGPAGLVIDDVTRRLLWDMQREMGVPDGMQMTVEEVVTRNPALAAHLASMRAAQPAAAWPPAAAAPLPPPPSYAAAPPPPPPHAATAPHLPAPPPSAAAAAAAAGAAVGMSGIRGGGGVVRGLNSSGSRATFELNTLLRSLPPALNSRSLAERRAALPSAAVLAKATAVKPAELKARDEDVVRALFALPHRCELTGVRFNSAAELAEYQEAQRSKKQTADDGDCLAGITSREWFDGDAVWKDGLERRKASTRAAARFFELPSGDAAPTAASAAARAGQTAGAGGAGAAGSVTAAGGAAAAAAAAAAAGGSSGSTVVQADDSQPACPVCKEEFDMFWDDAEGEWMFRNATRHAATGLIYHLSCLPSASSPMAAVAAAGAAAGGMKRTASLALDAGGDMKRARLY